ncbi:MAG TPA: glycosyltransferase [Nocardioidaceae bacterium]|nr:glycosyltransferase [Nocardioidaceae bacterium]
MSGSPDQLARLLDELDRLLLVRGPFVSSQAAARALPHPNLTDLALVGPAAGRPAVDPFADGGERTRDGVVLVVQDRVELRRVAAACRGVASATRLGCVLLDAEAPPLTAGRPHWPPVEELVAGASPVCFAFVRLAAPLDLGELVADLARRSTPRHLMSEGRPVLGVDRRAPHLWPPGDALSLVGSPQQVRDVAGDFPPEVTVTDAPAGAPADASAGYPPERSTDAVTGPGAGRPPGRSTTDHRVVGKLHELVIPAQRTWRSHDEPVPEPGRGLAGELPGLAVGPVDSAVLNPRGFLRRAEGPVRPLTPVPGSPHLCRVDTGAGEVVLDTRRGLGERDIPRLRALRGLHVDWRGGDGPTALCRLVVALAMTGVPLTGDPVPAWGRALLHPSLVEVLEHPASLDDQVLREVHSIRLRRAALTHHDQTAWRLRIAESAGAGAPPPPRVSVLLATRRPARLPFALRQVARQRGVDLEVVVATHGHDIDRRVVDELRDTSSVEVTSLGGPEDEPFGTLLNRAAERAGGDLLLKMDDDDWYGPDFAADLLLARRYSGADITGTAPEFLYVESLDLTLRRRDATEVFRPVVAGGTMLLARDTLGAVGGFRPMRRYVDAGLLQAVTAAGGSVYRSHGHGYLLRRGLTGHTWDPGLGYFVSRSRTAEQWRGFRPGPLLEVAEQDRPGLGTQVEV